VRNLLSLLLVLSGAALADPVLPIGRIDTIGGTTYDWQMGGPAYRWIVNAPGHGVPVYWIRSLDTGTAFPDRNIGYNYYDYSTRKWLGNDTSDFMNSGVNVFTQRSGFGSLDINPKDERSVLSAHMGTPLHLELAREVAPGSFVFEYSNSSPTVNGYLWPVTVVDTAGWTHAVLIDEASRGRIFYARTRTWEQWDSARAVAAPQPEPMFPSHHIATSRVSHRVVLTWTFSEGAPDPGFYRETTDGGTTWQHPTELHWPPAFSGETVPSYHISGLFPYYDRHDRLHVVCPVMPYINGRGYIVPVEMWHWCRENSPQWSRIMRVDADSASITCPVGYNALLACRPSLGEDRNGGLHVCWEQFDTTNIEPGPPTYMRADIWWSEDNDDNGASWRAPVRLTVPDATSKRFPSIMDWMSEDTLRVLYLVDLVAGFHVQGEGHPTENPIVVQHVPLSVGGVSDGPSLRPWERTFRMSPNPTSGNVRLEFSPAPPGSVKLSLFDRSGRSVFSARLPGHPFTGSRSLDLSHFPAGVYLLRLETSDGASVQPVVLLKEEP